MASAGGGKALFGVLGLVIGLVIGYGAGRVSTGTPVNPLQPSAVSNGGADGPGSIPLEFLPPPPTEAATLTGTVVEAEAGRLAFDLDVRSLDPRGALSLETRRTANLTAETRIIRLAEKSPQEFAAEHEAFSRAAQEASPDAPPPAAPLPFKEIPATVEDLMAGDTVSVEAASDVLRASSFDAVRVVIMPKPVAPAPINEPPPPAPAPVPEP